MAFAIARANVKVSGISTFKVRAVGDAGYYSLNPLRDGKIMVETITQKDSKGREFPYAFRFEASGKFFYTNKTNMLEVLDTLNGTNLIPWIVGTDGSSYAFELISATLGYTGFTASYVCDGAASEDSYVEVKATRILKLAEYDTILGSTSGISDSPTGGDALAAIALLVRADYFPSGIATATCSASGGNGTDDAFGFLRNTSIKIEAISEADSIGREIPYAANFQFSFESMQASSAEQLDINVISARTNKFILTGVSGTVFTLDNTNGINVVFNNDKDATGTTYFTVSGSGIVPFSSLDGIIS